MFKAILGRLEAVLALCSSAPRNLTRDHDCNSLTCIFSHRLVYNYFLSATCIYLASRRKKNEYARTLGVLDVVGYKERLHVKTTTTTTTTTTTAATATTTCVKTKTALLLLTHTESAYGRNKPQEAPSYFSPQQSPS